ncbi:MAG: pilus assembly protein PilN [Desulfocapsa sp.]|nr:MAG: pilus assembly protein PilN [Desulfocapsa sp.]
MLRINLLPIRQLRKQAKARNQIISFATLLAFLCLILGAVFFLQSTKTNNIASQVTKLKAEKQKYAPILKEMKNLEKAKKDLEHKISIINKLKQDSATTVHILDEVSNTVDSKRMWLKSLKQQGASLSLTGVALDNRTIAQFMDKLKGSPYISSVNLSNASLTKVSGRNLKSFSLACSIVTPQKKTPETKK